MKRIFQNRSVLQKIAIVLLITLMCYFIVPTYSFAAWDFGGDLLKVLVQLLAALGDVVSGMMNHFMLGTNAMISSVMLDQDDPTVTDKEGALYVSSDAKTDLILGQDKDASGKKDDDNEEAIDGGLWGGDDEWQIPNLLYSPETIFSNRVAALDVNFLNPNEYSAVQDTKRAKDHAKSAALDLQSEIANWYAAFRNIAVVALLTVLVYIGIRILISSTSSDKAKYKESLKDWLVALCLVFILQFIMAGILMLTQKVTELFSESSSGIIVQVRDNRDTDAGEVKFSESLMGVARLRVQSTNAGVATAYCLIYLILVVYTIMFTFTYLKRFLYMAFLTMIAPLVAITYPIDKLGDGKAQAFNMWFKEYTMNAILQPLHLVLYTALVSTANDLVIRNPIYAIVAIGFLIPAEKFVKKMFGFDKATTPGALGGFAAGAMTMNALKGLSKPHKIGSSGSGGGGKADKIRTADNNNKDYLSGSQYDGLDTVNMGKDSLTDQQSGLENSQVPPTQNADNSAQDVQQTDSDHVMPDSTENPDYGSKRLSDEEAAKLDEKFGGKPKFGDRHPTARAMKRMTIRGVNTARKGVWKNKGKIAKGIAKGVLVPGMALAGAGIGLAAGVASGDPSKAFQYAATGLGSGALIGSNAVNAAANLGNGAVDLAKGAANSGGKIRDAWNEERYGIAEADDMRNDREREKRKKQFLKDDAQRREAKKVQAKLAKAGKQETIEDIMESRFDYVSAGIKEDDIKRAQVAESLSGGMNGSTHGNYVSLAQETDRLGITASTFSDVKKYNEFNDTLSSALGSEEKGRRAMGMMAEIKGQTKAHESKMKVRMAQKEKEHGANQPDVNQSKPRRPSPKNRGRKRK